MKLSTLVIAKNAESTLEDTLKSVREISDELLVLDNESSDGTQSISLKYGAKIFRVPGTSLGKLKNYLIKRASKDWILILDSDEVISKELAQEISNILRRNLISPSAYNIPFQNHVFGKTVHYGGENYSKVRLFLNGSAKVQDYDLHEDVVINSKPGKMSGKIYHFSYRSPFQLLNKFTRYAIIDSKRRFLRREAISFKKIFAYGPHMFWSRFVKEQGYLDGLYGFIIAFAFAYMEYMTYVFLFLRKIYILK